MNDEERITKLEERVADLLAWKEERLRQQLTFPLDKISTDIVQKDVVVATGAVTIPPPLTDFFAMGIGYRVNGVQRVIITSLVGIVFTADSGTDTLTSTAHGLSDDDRIVLATTNTLPVGLDEITIYYVVSSTANTFKVSTSSGGSAVNFTTNGVGTHYFGKI